MKDWLFDVMGKSFITFYLIANSIIVLIYLGILYYPMTTLFIVCVICSFGVSYQFWKDFIQQKQK